MHSCVRLNSHYCIYCILYNLNLLIRWVVLSSQYSDRVIKLNALFCRFQSKRDFACHQKQISHLRMQLGLRLTKTSSVTSLTRAMWCSQFTPMTVSSKHRYFLLWCRRGSQNFLASDQKEKLDIRPGPKLVKTADLQGHNASRQVVSL